MLAIAGGTEPAAANVTGRLGVTGANNGVEPKSKELDEKATPRPLPVTDTCATFGWPFSPMEIVPVCVPRAVGV